MRRSGVLDRPSAEPGGHICWQFDDDAAFRRAAAAFLAEGAERGERVVYVADCAVDAMLDALEPLGDPERLLAAGDLELQPVRDLYEPDGTFDVGRQVEGYRKLVDRARDDGYLGLRVAADATALVTTDTARRRFLQYELAVDQLIASAPMTAMCAYDGRVLGPALRELCAVHPQHHSPDDQVPSFRAYYDAGGLRLAGDVDLVSWELFSLVLETVSEWSGLDVVIDLAHLDFIDVRSLTLLAHLAARLAATDRILRLLAVPAVVRRCCELLGFDRLLTAGVRP